MHTERCQKSQTSGTASDADYIVDLGDISLRGCEPPPCWKCPALTRRADVWTKRRTSEQPHLCGFCALEARRYRYRDFMSPRRPTRGGRKGPCKQSKLVVSLSSTPRYQTATFLETSQKMHFLIIMLVKKRVMLMPHDWTD